MCVLCGQGGGGVFTPCQGLEPQFSGGGGGGGGVPGGVLDALLALTSQNSARWNFPAAIGTPVAAPGGMGAAVSLTFGFLTSLPAEHAGTPNFQPLSSAQQAGMRAALAAWGEVARVSLTETAGATADLRIGRSDQASAGYAYFPSFGYSFNGANIITSVTAQPVGGDIFLANNLGDGFTPGGGNFSVALHEAGHALGLKHPFEAPRSLPAATDNLRYTVMSYTQPSNTGIVDVTLGAGGGYSWITSSIQPRTPMLYDIAAMQALYGANMATRAGNDSYGFADGERFLATIWDGGGIDTIDASAQSLRSIISLVDGTFSSIGLRLTTVELRREIPAIATNAPTPSYDGRDNLAIAFGAVIENAIGGAGDDLITGNMVDNQILGGAGNDTLSGAAGNDTLTGGAGADSLMGGDGFDFASYATALAGVTARLDFSSLNTGDGAGDGFSGIEGLIGTNFFDFLVGDAGDNTIYAGGTWDYVAGNAGNDLIFGEEGNDTLDGGAGNDTLLGGAGADSLIGGGGADFASYASATVFGVIARLDFPTLNLNEAAGDSYSGISGLIGTNFSDQLIGTTGSQTLQGGAGIDILIGNGGADTYIGGADLDFFGFTYQDFEVGVWDVIKDMNAGGVADWFTTSGVSRFGIWALDWQGGVIVTIADLGFGPTGGGVFIENFTTAQFWNQLLTQ